MTPRRAALAFSGLALALSGLTMTAAHATSEPFDVIVQPNRAATGNQALIVKPTDIAVDPNLTTGDVNRFAVSDDNPNFERVDNFHDNPFNTTGFSAGFNILDTKAHLFAPEGITFDPTGGIWVADRDWPRIGHFAKDVVNGTPLSTIQGDNTGLTSPYDVAVDKAGNVYVANVGPTASIRVFAAGRGGDIEPIRTINQGLVDPLSIAIDSKGLVYVADYNAGDFKINVYPADAESGTSPIRVINGGNTHLNDPEGLALDSADNLYVANKGDDGGSITIFASGANGNVFPNKRLLGSSGVVAPMGVAVNANREVYVVNDVAGTDSMVRKYPPLMPYVKASAPRSISVAGSSKSTTRKITWHTPTSIGDSAITKYLVVIKHGSKTIYNKSVTSRSFTAKRSTLSNGTNTVTITAVNKAGSSPSASKSFTVKK